MQAGVKQPFGIFPESATFLQPSERTFDDPTLGYNREGVQFPPLGDLHRCSNQALSGLGERLAGVAAVHQDGNHGQQVVPVPADGLKSPLPVGRVEQAL